MLKKVILNCRFGGYGWSKPALIDYLTAKGMNITYTVDDRPATKEQYLASKHNENIYGNGKYICNWDIDREDPVAIALLEEKGSEYCSGDAAKLCIKEYDDDLWSYAIDEYDGSETLDLRPSIPRERILACNSTQEILNLLDQVGVLRKRERRTNRIYNQETEDGSEMTEDDLVPAGVNLNMKYPATYDEWVAGREAECVYSV